MPKQQPHVAAVATGILHAGQTCSHAAGVSDVCVAGGFGHLSFVLCTWLCYSFHVAPRSERRADWAPAQALDTVETDLMDRVAAEYMSQRAQHAQHLSTLPPPPGR